MTVTASDGSTRPFASIGAPTGAPASASESLPTQTAQAPTAAGLLASAEAAVPPPPQALGAAPSADEAGGLPLLRVPSSRMPPGAQAIALQALVNRFTEVMTRITDLNVDTLVQVKDRQGEVYTQKIQDLARKLRQALGSWMNKLPGWLTKVATAVGTCLMAAMAIGATAASGGLAGPGAMVAMSAFLSMAGLASVVQSLGSIGWDMSGHKSVFGLEALEQSGALPAGVGSALDCFMKADIAGALTHTIDAIDTAGVISPHTLSIVGTVLAVAVAAAVMGTMLVMVPSPAVATNGLFKNAQLANNFTQVLQGVATSAQAGVTAGEVRNQVAATRAQAEADLARTALDAAVETLGNAIKFATVYFDANRNASDAAMQVLQSERRTASDLVAPTA